MRRIEKRSALVSLSFLGGCAPSVSAFGAYFPAWLLCSLIGVGAAIAARIALVALGLSEAVPAQFLVCSAVGVIVAGLCWLIWIG